MTVHKELGPANKHMSLVPDPSSSEPRMRPLVEILIVASWETLNFRRQVSYVQIPDPQAVNNKCAVILSCWICGNLIDNNK